MGGTESHLALWSWLVLTGASYLIIALLIPRILLQRRDPRATLAWLFFVLLVPYLGLLAFWALGATRLRMRRWRRRQARASVPEMPAATPRSQPTDASAPPIEAGLFRLARRLDPGCPPCDHHAVRLLLDGAEAFDAIQAAIDAARAHVHLLYYTWLPDGTGRRLLNALCAAAARGVEVRLLVDDVGSRTAKPAFFAPLVRAGGRVARFLPVTLVARRLAINHRNHRKIVVVDGQVGFTGGMNVGDDYAGVGQPWYDAHVRLEGPAVLRLQEVFCQDWYRTTEEDLSSDRYFVPPAPQPSGVWVQVIESGPDRRVSAIHNLLVAAIGRALERVWIVTPYFVPDAATRLALEIAALQGADVRLIIPGRTDHPLVSVAARSFYEPLLEAGVQIFEAPTTFVHAKVLTIDGAFATVGSANLDERSQHLNFELNAFVYGSTLAGEVERAFVALQADTSPVDATAHEARGWLQRGAEGVARLLAPVL